MDPGVEMKAKRHAHTLQKLRERDSIWEGRRRRRSRKGGGKGWEGDMCAPGKEERTKGPRGESSTTMGEEEEEEEKKKEKEKEHHFLSCV
uniref:Uncharacterized protein n=1 Tax=Caenorhabditis tropicalis TaxID=1561998 RepID=A0A1I7TQ40_9PELO